jgi:hypothetical protein
MSGKGSPYSPQGVLPGPPQFFDNLNRSRHRKSNAWQHQIHFAKRTQSQPEGALSQIVTETSNEFRNYRQIQRLVRPHFPGNGFVRLISPTFDSCTKVTNPA